jgi:hypothetical protein
MKYSYKTEQREYICRICNHRQYAVSERCLNIECCAVGEMYHPHKCKQCGEWVQGENAYIKNRSKGLVECKQCRKEINRKASLKNYHMKKMRGEL